jgi:ATP-dependent Clp protease ATP-binding subunit ClpA
MYERFTDRARKVMQLANQEAQRFNHEYIGTEHILLGLIKEGSGIAAAVLKELGVELSKARLEVEKLMGPGPDITIMGKLPQTPRAKRVVELAMEAARELKHGYVGTEHILIGLIREKDGAAGQVLANLGVTAERVIEAAGALFADPSDPFVDLLHAIARTRSFVAPPTEPTPIKGSKYKTHCMNVKEAVEAYIAALQQIAAAKQVPVESVDREEMAFVANLIRDEITRTHFASVASSPCP